MGPILEVAMHKFIALSLLALLTGCGSPSPDGTTPLSRQMLDRSLSWLKPKAPEPVPEPEVFTRASVTKDQTGPVILVNAPKLEAKASLNMIQENGPTRTYISDDGIVLLLQNGLLAASRGFGDDLMSSVHSAAHGAIVKGSGQYERVLRYINSQNHLEALPLTCSLQDQGAETVTILGHKHKVFRRLEICNLAGRQIENMFWISGKTIWKSHQWVSDQIGSLTIEQVQ